MEPAGKTRLSLTARNSGRIACQTCTKIWPAAQTRCQRCGARLYSRRPESLQKVWAWLIAGMICYVPANLYPMLQSKTLFTNQSDTIIGGAIQLAHHGSWFVALIILIASVLIPIGKFIAIAYLAVGMQQSLSLFEHKRHKLFEWVEFVGRWSMIDVFVVAILSALVQLKSLASITPGPAAIAFAASVIFTMLSAQSFDSRLIWDNTKGPLRDV